MSKPLPNVFTRKGNCITPLGIGIEANWEQLVEGKSSIQPVYFSPGLGEVWCSTFPSDFIADLSAKNNLPTDFTRFEQLCALALQDILPPTLPESALLILSTTKGNINALHTGQQSVPPEALLHTSAEKLARHFKFSTVPLVVSNACVSGIQAMGIAKNMLQIGLAQDVFIVAADEVSRFVVSGFTSFQAISASPCRPYDKNRDGINLGEAAAAIHLSTVPPVEGNIYFKILAENTINDANHISGPSRTGEGLYQSIQKTLAEADLNAATIDFISAHGTATLYNDEMESFAFSRAGLAHTPLHSLKGNYGHTLGAAGLLELLVAMKSAQEGVLLPTKNYTTCGVSHPLSISTAPTTAESHYFLKTASGFGGNNTAVLIEKVSQQKPIEK